MPIPINEVVKGIYLTEDGGLAKVQKSRTSNRFYAKKLNNKTFEFEYENGLVYHLKERLTLEQAQAFGKLTGRCCACGLTLTNAKSVELGIGPICRGYF